MARSLHIYRLRALLKFRILFPFPILISLEGVLMPRKTSPHWGNNDIRQLRNACEAGGIQEALSVLNGRFTPDQIHSKARRMDVPINEEWSKTENEWFGMFCPYAAREVLSDCLFPYRGRGALARRFELEQLTDAYLMTPGKRDLALSLVGELDLPEDADHAIDFQMLLASALVLDDHPRGDHGNGWSSAETAILYWSYRAFGGTFTRALFRFQRTLRSIQQRAKMLGFSSGGRWTSDEVASLQSQYEAFGPSNCDRIVIPGRTESAIVAKLYKLGHGVEGPFFGNARSATGNTFRESVRRIAAGGPRVRETQRWTDADIALLKLLYPRSPRVADVAASLERSLSSVANKASELGLRKPDNPLT